MRRRPLLVVSGLASAVAAALAVAVLVFQWPLPWSGRDEVRQAGRPAPGGSAAPGSGAAPGRGGNGPAGGGQGAPGGAAGPPEVGVVTVEPREIPLPIEFAGRVIAPRDVEVRARVGGLLLSRNFGEGGRVRRGELLFRIDPATYEVALTRARAQLAQAQAALREAEQNYTRVQELAERQVAAEQRLDAAIATRDRARAAIDLAGAEVRAAELNLEYTRIEAPVTGATALTSPAIGTLILAQQTLLTTITPLDPAYVSFSFTDTEAQAFRELNSRRERPISQSDLRIELRYGDGTAYPRLGRIDTAAERVDPQTGTIQARAVFANPDGTLLPGQFVRIGVRGITLPDALVVPKRAVSQGPQGSRLFVLNAQNAAEARPVRLGEELEDGYVVRSGLSPGDRVVVDGIIRVRPGQPVRPVPVSVSSAAAPSPTALPASTPDAVTPPVSSAPVSSDPASRDPGRGNQNGTVGAAPAAGDRGDAGPSADAPAPGGRR